MIQGDLKDEKFCKAAVQETIEKFGGLNVVTNYAAVQFPKDSIGEISKSQLKKTFETNIYHFFYIVKDDLPHMQKGIQ